MIKSATFTNSILLLLPAGAILFIDVNSFNSSPPPTHPPSIAVTASRTNSILRTSSNELLDYGRKKLDYVPQKRSQQMSGKVSYVSMGFLQLSESDGKC